MTAVVLAVRNGKVLDVGALLYQEEEEKHGDYTVGRDQADEVAQGTLSWPL